MMLNRLSVIRMRTRLRMSRFQRLVDDPFERDGNDDRRPEHPEIGVLRRKGRPQAVPDPGEDGEIARMPQNRGAKRRQNRGLDMEYGVAAAVKGLPCSRESGEGRAGFEAIVLIPRPNGMLPLSAVSPPTGLCRIPAFAVSSRQPRGSDGRGPFSGPDGMGLSDWQLDRLRNALAAYHAYGRGSGGEPFNWKDVAEGILDVAGPELLDLTDDRDTDIRRKRVRQFSERLRQFVEGVTVRGQHKRPRLQDDWLDATLRFALHEDYALLTEDELREHAPDRHAAVRLLEYLALKDDRERILPPAVLEGLTEMGAWSRPRGRRRTSWCVRSRWPAHPRKD
ncbi:MAG: hypothetical protein M5U33_00620 [Pseudorhodoplanes sp.]|nr:hypothetical protein [Pseudorhodoplanes sp.]